MTVCLAADEREDKQLDVEALCGTWHKDIR